ncbi:hypothetical protein J8J40_33630, partial [Mycobacterium tuberculosis]|nr:hypothetical protein [Mycobacterium tuberculosis]
LDHGNELGRIARAVAVFRDGLARSEDLAAANAEAERRHADDRRIAMQGVAADFERRILTVVDLVAAAAEELEASAASLNG